ncbi:estradiol 17-beta-dehydrogenase 11-like, partial [Notechis scutatus]|uniref:Estradiol 17-beta-dehydrogenase 11-like n=1 Tax=Notechis scutatus TaxID=8663 RepID=A0A6J1UBS5_9SAUR
LDSEGARDCLLRKSVAGEIVLITGAASGIGKLIAFEFAKQRSRLVLWDINKSGIEETAEDCRKLGVEAYPYVVDCSLKEDIYSVAEKVKKDVGDITILVNNAGVATTADLLSTQDKQIQKIYDVNILAHFWVSITENLNFKYLVNIRNSGLKLN